MQLGDMSKETVLSRIEADLNHGDLGKARDRLHTLVHDYPDDVSLRAQLAQVYHRLQFPAMAGRYWYLEDRRTPEMEASIAAFERSCGGDPLVMLSAIKYRGAPDDEMPDHARKRLMALRQAVRSKYGFFPDAYTPSRMLRSGRGGVPLAVLEKLEQERRMIGRRHIFLGAKLAGVAVMALAATGLISIAWWVYNALG